jgi:very-short-patch-repair endonuclease
LRTQVEATSGDLGLAWDGGPADAQRLVELLTLLDDRWDIPPAWLSSEALDQVDARIADLETAQSEHRAATAALAGITGEGRTVDADRAVPVRTALERLRNGRPTWTPGGDPSAGELTGLVGFLSDSAGLLASIEADARQVAEAFGLSTTRLAPTRAVQLAELSKLTGSPTPPEARWLDPTVQAALTEAIRVLGQLLGDYRARQGSLREVFTNEVLNLDLNGLKVRFTSTHRGLRKLGGAYRRDKKALAACTVSGRVDRAVLDRLGDAVAWQELASRLSTEEHRHAPLIGEHYYQRDTADFTRISAAIDTAQQALRLIGDELGGTALTDQLARDGARDPRVLAVAERLRVNAEQWLQRAHERLGDVASELAALSIPQVAEWCAATGERLAVLCAAVEHVSSVSARPVSLGSTAAALERAEDLRLLAERVAASAAADSSLLGGLYQGLATDLPALQAARRWADRVRAQLGGPVHRLVAEELLRTPVRSAEVREHLIVWMKAATRVTEEFTDRRAQEIHEVLTQRFDDAEVLLDELSRTVGDVEEWSAHTAAWSALEQAGLRPVLEFCAERWVDGDLVPKIVERALLEAWADDVLNSDEDRFGAMRAADRDALVDGFRTLDRALVADSAARVINACSVRRPSSNAGPAGTIVRQAQLRRGHMPIRKLLSEAGGVAQQLKPCFMMSPLSVSQYLPSTLKFDVVIFDEASQVRPADAINCVYRGQQLIVAGDQKQLPPSDFFARVDSVGDDTYDEDREDEFESLLDLCKGAGGLRSMPLNWHYRSEHESLITYSNYRFYKGKLLTFPGATDAAPDVGIELFKVDGTYRRGGPRDNPVEAAKVVERVRYHLLNHPELTLGVVAFSSTQEDAIDRELDRQAERYPELAGLRTEDRLNGFFVKSLENVQGDERDVIVFSIGYGPDEAGKFTLNMGPLNRQGGWRRLNVAITRAKRRVEVVTSILAEDFTGDSSSEGIRHLRGYLDFAHRGVPALALSLEESQGDVESPFEEEVLRTIRDWGYDAVPQVGVAGYRIDIAVRHRDKPGRYALGVECDGAMYHSSKVARDRDRLRQQVLEGLDWRIHRIWGTSWYRDRAGQEARLKAAIEESFTNSPVRPVFVPSTPVVHREEVDLDAPPSWTRPYRPILVKAHSPYEMHEAEAQGHLRSLIEAVVRGEGPVHEDRVLATVRTAWGMSRSGSRIRDAFDRAVTSLARGSLQRDRSGFLRDKGSALDVVRVPVADDEDTQRPVKHLPPEELRLAVGEFIADAHPITREELTTRVARLFGWARRGPDIRAALEDAVDALLAGGEVSEVGDRLISAPGRSRPAAAPSDPLVKDAATETQNSPKPNTPAVAAPRNRLGAASRMRLRPRSSDE